jgi:hypothetical protein
MEIEEREGKGKDEEDMDRLVALFKRVNFFLGNHAPKIWEIQLVEELCTFNS